MPGYLSADVIRSEMRRSRKTVSFEEQIMSKGKYPSIFSPQMEAIVFIMLLIIYMKKLLDSDWLRVVQFKCNTSAKSVTPVQKV